MGDAAIAWVVVWRWVELIARPPIGVANGCSFGSLRVAGSLWFVEVPDLVQDLALHLDEPGINRGSAAKPPQ